jgi:hypothetical protein
MDARSGLTTSVQVDTSTLHATRLFREGIIAGLLGGATIAVWFLIFDTLAGHPLYTPSLLGAALFKAPHLLTSPQKVPISLDMVLAFSCVHGLIFAAVGAIGAWLLSFAEQEPYLGLGGLFLFLLIVFEFGFLAAAMFFSEVILYALSWMAILVGNGFAAVAMGVYLWQRHPALAVKDVKETFFS